MFVPPAFDRDIAKTASLLVLQAYEQFVRFKHNEPWALEGDFDDIGHVSARPPGVFAHVEPFGFVARSRATGDVYVVFRGTQSLEDWLSNVSFPQVDHAWGAVEKGFSELYAQCSSDVKRLVQSAGSHPVVVTGHSLGGALSTLAVSDLVQGGTTLVALYNFASPRTGDPQFARTMNQHVPACWRVVNTEDIVTTVPLATPIVDSHAAPAVSPLRVILETAHRLDYEHVGAAVSFTEHHGSIVGNHDMKVYDRVTRSL